MDFGDFPSLFGKPLSELYLGTSGAPDLLECVFDEITKELEREGIFRIPGNRALVTEMGVLLNFPACSVPPVATVHDVISFLKKWLLDLPEPILIPSIVNEYYNKDDPKSITKIIKELPEVNRKTLFLLISLLLLVLNSADKNKMNMANLTICFQVPLFQENKGLKVGIPFDLFINHCASIINETFDDFKLEDC